MRLLVLLLFCASVGHGTAEAQVHQEVRLPDSRAPLANAALDGRIAEAAREYRQYGRVSRIAFYDLAYPADSQEFARMNGYGLLVLTALSQDSTELPPSRLAFHHGNSLDDLPLIAVRRSPSADSLVKAVLGPYRSDALYLLPTGFLRENGELLLDFAAHRQAFRMGTFDGATPAALQPFPPLVAVLGPPDTASVWAMFRREYPDLAPALHPR